MQMVNLVAETVLDQAVTIGLIASGVGYAIGQLFRSRRQALSDSLATALDEVSAIRIKVERLEAEINRQNGIIDKLQKEKQVLRSLTMGEKVPQVLIDGMKPMFEDVVSRISEEIKNALK